MLTKGYTDEFGFLHHIKNPKPDSSENPLTFTGNYFLLKPKEPGDVELLRHLNSLVCKDGKYRPTPVTEWGVEISHDDATMWFGALYRYGLMKEVQAFRPVFPNHYQPWNIAYYHAIKKENAKVPWVSRMAGELSCIQGYKVRNGRKIAKTDGKILALGRMLATQDHRQVVKLTRYIATTWHIGPLPDNNKQVPIVRGQTADHWCWGSWFNIYADYFQMDFDYPNVVLSRQLPI